MHRGTGCVRTRNKRMTYNVNITLFRELGAKPIIYIFLVYINSYIPFNLLNAVLNMERLLIFVFDVVFYLKYEGIFFLHKFPTFVRRIRGSIFKKSQSL